jgi:NAD(P)-dependent dehydrogenase (short-subunit alcohol dehydrogenase family)
MKPTVAGQFSLHEKVVVVTGGARGIGLAIAELAKQCGAQVVACDLSSENGDETHFPEGYLCLHGDVSCEQDCNRLIEETLERFGRVDVLVNNAGILEASRSTVNQDLENWKKVMDVNLQGTFLMSRAAARAMASQGIHGSIINISSVVGLSGFRASNAYGVSKAGVAMLTKTLSVDLASRQIRVNAVAPGFIHTAMSANIEDHTKIEQDAFIRRIPLGRFGDATEIAQAVVFLASDHASYITGAVLPVDGGWLAFGGPTLE